MRSIRYLSILIGLAAFACVGCQNKLADENKALWQQNRELQASKADLEARLRQSPDPAMVQSMQSELAQRNKEIEDLKAALQRPVNAPPGKITQQPGLEGVDATYDPVAGTITVTLPGKILFASGSDALKDSAKGTLNTVISSIRKKYANKQVYVDGFTDTDPIRKSSEKWDDNLELSAYRAITVARYLTSHGLSSKQVAVRAFGPNKPKATKEASRRVEIVVAVR